MLFLAPIVLPRLRPIFASPSLRYLGYISYPLYLSHEDSVAAIAQYLYVTSGGSVALSAILIAVVLVIFSATLVAKFDEPFVRRLLAPFYVAITQALIGARAPTPSFATEQRIETTQATALLLRAMEANECGTKSPLRDEPRQRASTGAKLMRWIK